VRIGQNPAKSVPYVAQPERVTVAVVIYIPVLGGYYAQSLEVFKVCLNSLWEHTELPFDLMVFDNASCEEVRAYLSEARDAGRIQYLVLSEKNIGKAGAWNFIFGAAPGEVIAYADSDVYYYPGWLSALLEVLDAFPNLGMVTGIPMWSPEEFSTSTIEWAERTPEVTLKRGRFLPWEDYWQHSRSRGASETQAREHYESVEDICIVVGDKKYYVGAGHFQFLARREVLQRVTPIPSERPMGQVRLLDIALNERGYLRLSTPKWWVRHLGNTLEGMELPGGRIRIPTDEVGRRDRRTLGLWRWKPLRGVLRWVYHRSFEILYRE
jgi:glycosyltransferase involved in cell wall biosynthesis